MHRVRSLLFALLTAVVMGSFAASTTFATPKSTSILLLPGNKFPVKFSSLPSDNPNNKIKGEIQTAAGSLHAEGLSLKGELTKETSGVGEVTILNVEEPVSKEKCNTTGDGLGEALAPPGNFTLVHDENEEKGAAEKSAGR